MASSMNNINKKMIMRLVLDGRSSEIRSLMLCRSQLDLYEKTLKAGELTAKQVSDAYGISIQNASMKLVALFKKGYLARDVESADSGGIEYVYMPIDLSVKYLELQQN